MQEAYFFIIQEIKEKIKDCIAEISKNEKKMFTNILGIINPAQEKPGYVKSEIETLGTNTVNK